MTLIEALKRKGWTQRQLAKESGLSEQEVSRYAKGAWPALAEAEAMVTALATDVDVHDLLAPWESAVLLRWGKRQAKKLKKEGGK